MIWRSEAVEITPEMRHCARCAWLWIGCVVSSWAVMYAIAEVAQ
jgi:hypothetical protein